MTPLPVKGLLVFISEWQWDEINLRELAAHGLTREIVLQVAEETPGFRANKKQRAASHQMVGPDFGGTMWVICIVEVKGQPGLWRAITGWRARDPEEAWYRRHR